MIYSNERSLMKRKLFGIPYFHMQCFQLLCIFGTTVWLTHFIYRQTHKDWIEWGKGENEYTQRQFEKAIDFYKEAVKLGFSDPRVYERLGDSYASLANFSAAFIWYKLYLDKNPQDIAVRYRYANSLENMGRYEEAAKQYTAIETQTK